MNELFTNKTYTATIQKGLPTLFHVANEESKRGGKIGMEVGSLRERILIALLFVFYGKKRVSDNVSITNSEADVFLDGAKVSVKTSTNFHKFKLKWTANRSAASSFVASYRPTCHLLYGFIKWNDWGGLYFVSEKIQVEVFNQIGRAKYLKIPNDGTNNRGIEIDSSACEKLISHPGALKIPIMWKPPQKDYNPVDRWVGEWEKI